jgi:hypothetical protein
MLSFFFVLLGCAVGKSDVNADCDGAGAVDTGDSEDVRISTLGVYTGSRDGSPLKSDWIIDVSVILELLPVVSVPGVLPSFSVFCVRFERRASANWLQLVKTTPLP